MSRLSRLLRLGGLVYGVVNLARRSSPRRCPFLTRLIYVIIYNKLYYSACVIEQRDVSKSVNTYICMEKPFLV